MRAQGEGSLGVVDGGRIPESPWGGKKEAAEAQLIYTPLQVITELLLRLRDMR